MKLKSLATFVCAGLLLSTTSAAAQQVDLGNRPVLEAATHLKTGQFIWAPQLAPEGPLLVIVNLATQRVIVFRDGTPIAASTTSTGKPGYETPTGVFTILEKQKVHFSKTYDNAPMPNMQRLTWKGISLHAGHLPGYPASHGCIRLPPGFASLLFGTTSLGMTVVITQLQVGPELSKPPQLAMQARQQSSASFANAAYHWESSHRGRGVVSVVVSTTDQRAIVLQDGKEIGSAPVRYAGTLTSPVAYVLKSRDSQGDHWLKLHYAGTGGSMEVSSDEGSKFDAPTTFKRQLAELLRPGSVVIVTPQALKAGSPGANVTVIDDADAKN
jgi:hypothetical protein